MPPSDRAERLAIIAAVMLVAVGNLSAAVLAALLVLIVWGLG